MTPPFSVEPTGAALGADIVGVRSEQLLSVDLDALQQALDKHLVLRVRDAGLDDDGFEVFARRFGELATTPIYTRTGAREVFDAKHPMMSIVSNIVEDGQPIGETGDGELNWHTDLGFVPQPAALTMLLAREVPSSGGETGFTDMYAALDAMPEPLRGRLSGLTIKHQESHNAQGQPRPGYADYDSDDIRDWPGPCHPILRRHPSTGRHALYLGRRFGSYIPGLPLDESESLLDEIWSHAGRDGAGWAQSWQLGDLVIWDNRCTMHRRNSFAGAGRRRMHRFMVTGEVPTE